MIDLEPGKTYRMPIKNGHLDIWVSSDPDYPGLDIEYIDDGEAETGLSEDYFTRPRVLIECPKDSDRLRTLVWSNPRSEDYNSEIIFETINNE
jgi:hypothetical protein